MNKLANNERGYALLTIVMVLSLAAMLMSSSLLQSATGLRTSDAANVRAENFASAESSIERAVSWLRQNSQKMVLPFRREEFYNKMSRAGAAVGSNDTSAFQVPTRIRMSGNNNTVMLVSDNILGSANYPATEDITTNIAVVAAAEFAAADFGDAEVRLTLVDVVAKEPTEDFGNPPAAAPTTDFYPVYRLDAMTDIDSGSHVTAIVTGNVVNLFDIGFYGETYLEFRQSCDSYRSSDGPYSAGTRRANCVVGSNSTSAIHKNEEVYGSIKTNGDIDADPPFGGEACADFIAGCPNKGETCAGEDCGVPLLEDFETWSSYCPTDQGALLVANGTTMDLTLSSGDPMDNCWDTVTIEQNAKLVLKTSDYPYFFKTIIFDHNTAQMEADPATAGGVIQLFVETLDGNSINGNQAVNASGLPHQLIMYYLGAADLTLNGNADMYLALVAPNAHVDVLGNFDYYGALLANSLNLSGSGAVHYDEDLGGTGMIVNVQYRHKTTSPRYR